MSQHDLFNTHIPRPTHIDSIDPAFTGELKDSKNGDSQDQTGQKWGRTACKTMTTWKK